MLYGFRMAVARIFEAQVPSILVPNPPLPLSQPDVM